MSVFSRILANADHLTQTDLEDFASFMGRTRPGSS
jgi:hypothetical protein